MLDHKSAYQIVKEYSQKTGIRDTKIDTILKMQEEYPMPESTRFNIPMIWDSYNTTFSNMDEERFRFRYIGSFDNDWFPRKSKFRTAILAGISAW